MTRKEAEKVDCTPENNRGEAIYTEKQRAAMEILKTPMVDWSKVGCDSLKALEILYLIKSLNRIPNAINDRVQVLLDAISLSVVDNMEKMLVAPKKKYEILIRKAPIIDRVVYVNANSKQEAMESVETKDGEFVAYAKEVNNE